MSRSRLIARNVASTIATQVLSWGMTFALTLYLPRYLGDVGMGLFTLAGSIAAIASLIVSVGASNVLVREIARNHDRASELVTTALTMRVMLGFLAMAAAEAAVWILHYGSLVRVLVAVGMGGMLLAQFNDVLTSALIGLEQLPRQNLAALVEKVISTSLTMVLILHRQPWWTIMAVGIVSNSFSLAVSAVALKPFIRRIAEPRVASMMNLVRAGLPFMTTAVFVAVYGQSDAIVLSKLVHPHKLAAATIGWYSLGRRLNGTILFIPIAVTTALLPTLARLSKEEPHAFLPMVRRLMNLMVIAVVPFAAIMIFAPLQVLRFLHYPESFVSSVPVLAVLGGGSIVWYLSQVAGTALIASDLQGALSRITGIAALISVPLCIALSSFTLRYFQNGATGAAIADVLVETYLLMAYLRALPHCPFGWTNITTLGRASAAAVPLVVALYLTNHWGLILGAFGGVALYLPLCWLLRCIDPRDVSFMRQVLARRTVVETAGGPYVAK
jgi:O-antigen/teichoic acid export membrane protein